MLRNEKKYSELVNSVCFNISIFKRKPAKLTIDKLKYAFTCKRESEYNPERENLQINQSISAITFKMAAAERRNCVRI